MKIKVFIKDALTGQVIRNNEVITQEYSFEQMDTFHKQFEKKYPNAHVNFSWTPKGATQPSFICGMPLNMKLDETKVYKGKMSEAEYDKKWYANVPELA